MSRNKPGRSLGKRRMGSYILPIVLVGTIVICSLLAEQFLTRENMTNLIVGSATFGILACGMTMVLLTGEVDLSVGSQVALTSVITAMVSPYSPVLACLAAVLVTLGIGYVNGVLLVKTKMPSFVMTLGTMGIVRSIALVISNGQPVYGVPQGFAILTKPVLGPIPVAGLLVAALYVLTFLFLRYTQLGRCIYAVGSNSEAARLAGIDVNKVKVFVYSMSGLLAGIAGLVYTSIVTLGLPDGGVDYETQAITAAIIGGASFFGGEGEIYNTFMGLMILGMLGNIMNLRGVSPFVQPVAVGLVVILAVMLRSRRTAQ